MFLDFIQLLPHINGEPMGIVSIYKKAEVFLGKKDLTERCFFSSYRDVS